jgi:Ca2+-transporting ATPase
VSQHQPTSVYHTQDGRAVIAALKSRARGLTSAEARERLSEFGPNELAKKRGISPWRLFLEQFKSLLIIILLFAVVLSAVIGEPIDAIIIGVIVLFACGLGFIQEYRAERAMEALKKMAAPTASVLRDDREQQVPARDLVPGDIVILRTGDRIPADAQLLEAVNLKTNEAPLTGESAPVEKNNTAVQANASIGDRRNVVFTGTAAVYGRGTAIVTATGMKTEFGKIAGMLQDVKTERTPLQINLDRMGKRIAIVGLSLCLVLAVLGIFRGHEFLEMLVWGIALAVAAVPEALPAVVVISLALGVRRMVKRHALIRRLPAVETLGCTTVICSDKTGTMTQDQMTIRRIYCGSRLLEVAGAGYDPVGSFSLDGKPYDANSDAGVIELLRIGCLCNDARLVRPDSASTGATTGAWSIKGDPTEGALLVAAAKAGLLKEAEDIRSPRVREVPFSSETKMMTTFHKIPGGEVAYIKGAPEVILERCGYVVRDGQQRSLSNVEEASILATSRTMAREGLRIIGLAQSPIGDSVDMSVHKGFVFSGLVGMIDPPRPEVKAAIKSCEEAGIKTVMITGDHKLTAVAVAKELGVLRHGTVMSGAELDALSDEQFQKIAGQVDVFARVSPAHKLRVVTALIGMGHVVAVTGDGVNDAPALKKADIGIAMGITGTDVSKEAAAMVLTNDNFASIVAAVEEGRGIYDNIKKYLMFLLSSNIGEILLMAAAILLGPVIGLPYGAIPLIAIQILWVNLATDGLPAIALSIDPPAPDIMKQKPRPRGQGIFTKPVLILMAVGGLWSCIVNLGIFKWALDSGRGMVEAQALCFLTLIIIQFFKAYNFRSDIHSIFRIGFFRNKWLNLAIAWEVALLGVIVYTPMLQDSFHTFSLSAVDWAIVILSAGTVFPALELTKLFIRRRENKGPTVRP